jgi:hypothetical protein
MKHLLLTLLLGGLALSCNQSGDQAGATGSGAGVEREEASGRQDVEGSEDTDLNITTPIDARPELEEPGPVTE